MSIARIHSAGELLASVEALLGFTPRESVVVVGIDRRGRLAVMIRVDKADCLIAEVARELGWSIARRLEREGLAEAVVVSFTDGPLAAPCEALEALVPYLREAVELRDAWIVSGRRYRSQWCLDSRCCPSAGTALPKAPAGVGHALPESEIHPREAPRVGASAGDASSEPSGATAGSRGGEASAAAQRRRATRARDRALASQAVDPQRWRARRLAEWRDCVTEALDGHMPSDAMCGRIVAGLTDVQVRDAVIVDLNSDFAGAADDVVAGESSDRVRSALDGLMGGSVVPDSARVEAAVDVCVHVARLVSGRRPDPCAAAPLSVGAIGLWWLRDDCGARHCLDAALEADPEYHLAQLVLATITARLAAVLEGWD